MSKKEAGKLDIAIFLCLFFFVMIIFVASDYLLCMIFLLLFCGCFMYIAYILEKNR